MSIFEMWKQGFQWMKFQDGIGEPPWDYNYLYNLDKSEYPKYLTKIYKYRTGNKLPVSFEFKFEKKRGIPKLRVLPVLRAKNCKTFNEKIQWLKLYDATQIKRELTDKINVRNYVRKTIGEEYLKPVLQVCNSFEDVCFEKLPNSFVIKCNHGSKWQFIIKNKEDYLQNKQLFDLTRKQMKGWLEQDYSFFGGFEMQYNGIKPRILIEPLMREDINKSSQEIDVFCIKGMPKLIVKIHNENEITVYDKDFKISKNIFENNKKMINIEADDLIKQTFDLSKKLAKGFLLVRVDWMIYQNKIYFEEMTFTPDSGFNTNFTNMERLNNEFRLN